MAQLRQASRSLAFGNPDQTVAGDDRTVGGHDDVTKADQLCQMRRRHRRPRRGDRDLDEGGEFLGRQKPGCMEGHFELAINRASSEQAPAGRGVRFNENHSIHFGVLMP